MALRADCKGGYRLDVHQAHWGTINIVIPSEDQVSKNSSMARRNSGRPAKEHGVQASICLGGLFKVCICSFNSANKSNITSLFCCSSEGNKVQTPAFLYLFDLLDSLLHRRGPTTRTVSPYLWAFLVLGFSQCLTRDEYYSPSHGEVTVVLTFIEIWVSMTLKGTLCFLNCLISHRFHRGHNRVEKSVGEQTQVPCSIITLH